MPVAAGVVMSAKYPITCCTYDCQQGRNCPLNRTPPIPKGDEMETKTDTATPSSPLVEDVRVAMRKAFNFGQNYFHQANSDSVAQNAKSDETATKFRQLVTDTCTALAAGIAQSAAPQGYKLVPIEMTPEMQMAAVSAIRIETTLLNKMFMANGAYRAAIAAAPEVAQPAAPSDAALASTLTQSSDRALWTEEQRENHRKNLALVYSCTECCARKGEMHLPSCSEQGICGA